MKRKKISWIHISDLQFGNEQIKDVVYSTMLTDIRTLNDIMNIDVIFVTGDLTWKGNVEQFEIAAKFLDQLAEATNLTKDCIFCVPGNHDILRSGNDNVFINTFKSSDDVDGFISSGYTELINPKSEEFLAFAHKNFAWADELKITTSFFTQNIIINEIRVAIIGLNSAWAENIYTSKVTIGEHQLLEALSKIDNADITIALMHHSIEDISGFEKENINEILQDRCDFVLHGHSHKQIEMFSPFNEMYFVSSGSTYERGKLNFSYNLGSINLDKCEESFFVFRKYDDILHKWFDDNSFNGNGRVTINLPLRLTTSANEFISNKMQVISADDYFESDYNLLQLKIDIPKPPKYLLNAIEENKCILFAGAGASADAKLPNWAELVLGMTKMVIDIDDENEKNVGEIQNLLEEKEYIILADYCKKQLGAFDFSNYIKSKLDISHKQSITHGLLSKIPFRSVITTNFDAFFEEYRVNSRVVYPDDLEKDNIIDTQFGDGSYHIYKIHGSYDKPDSIVLTKSDFRNILFNKAKYKQQLKQLFLQNVIFFYGYSFTDPDIDFLLQEIMAEYDGKSRKHYALLPDISRIKKDYLQREYNIRVIPYKTINRSHFVANEFLKKILNQLEIIK